MHVNIGLYFIELQELIWSHHCSDAIYTARGFDHTVSVSLFTVWRVFESVTVSNFYTSAFMHTIHTFYYWKSFQ